MYLVSKENGGLVKVLDISALVDPCRSNLPGQCQADKEGSGQKVFKKSALSFPSGGALPRYWLEPD